MENNEKKKIGRRFFLGEQATWLITGAFVLCMFRFDELDLGLKWFIVYSVLITAIAGLVGKFLTTTDIKEILSKINPLKK